MAHQKFTMCLSRLRKKQAGILFVWSLLLHTGITNCSVCKTFFHTRLCTHAHTLTHENKIQASIQVFLNSFQSCPLNKSSEFMREPCTTASCNLGVCTSFDTQLTSHHAPCAYFNHKTTSHHPAHKLEHLHCASCVPHWSERPSQINLLYQ